MIRPGEGFPQCDCRCPRQRGNLQIAWRCGKKDTNINKDILGIIEEEVVKLDPAFKGEGDNESFQTAVVLLAAADVVGPEIDSLVAFTGYSGDFIVGISHNMRTSGFRKAKSQTLITGFVLNVLNR